MKILYTLALCSLFLVDTYGQLVSVAPEGLNEGILYGQSISLYNDDAIISAPREEINGMTFTGAIYVHTRDDFGWEHTQKIVGSDANEYDEFGYAVEQSLRFAAVSSPFKGTGAVYIFSKEDPGSWQEVQKITIPRGFYTEFPDAQFGHSISISDSFLVISAPGFMDTASTAASVGGVFVYKNIGGNFTFLQYLENPDKDFAHFGENMVLDDKEKSTPKLLVTAPEGGGGAENSGVVYLYEYFNDEWQITYTFIDPFSRSYEFFGSSADIHGDNVIIGTGMYTAREDEGPKGAAHIFQKYGNTWIRTGMLEAPDGGRNDMFGQAVQIEDNIALVGAPRNSHSGFINSGKVYAFTLQNGHWLHNESYIAPLGEVQPHMHLGAKIHLHEGHALISAHLMDNVHANSGNTYHHNISHLVNTKEIPGVKYHEIKVVPNPAYDEITLQLAKDITYPLDIAVYDIQGKVIQTHRAVYSNSMDVSTLSPGTYFVFVRSEAVNGTAKFIKAN
jgi:hypothetical protein